jgi:hypothetical protein
MRLYMKDLDCPDDAETYDQHLFYLRSGTEEKAGLTYTSRCILTRAPECNDQDSAVT